MKRLVWSLVITGALILASVPEASASGGQYRAYDNHYAVRQGHNYPYRLRRNDDFRRWYGRSHYRYGFYTSWDRLFDIYRYERRYQRPYRYYDRRGYNRHRRHRRRH